MKQLIRFRPGWWIIHVLAVAAFLLLGLFVRF
jgi:hypothetical protein